MSPSDYKCPLCGYEFESSERGCSACPMASGCKLVCCPKCGYGFAEESRLVSWVKALARRVRKPKEGAGKPGGAGGKL